MENNNNAQQQTNGNKGFCSGNCLGCSFQQQVYCAAQHGHAIMQLMPNLFAYLESVNNGIKAISEKMVQSSNEPLINPLEKEETVEE